MGDASRPSDPPSSSLYEMRRTGRLDPCYGTHPPAQGRPNARGCGKAKSLRYASRVQLRGADTNVAADALDRHKLENATRISMMVSVADVWQNPGSTNISDH